jgi:hypothetical protein
MEMEMEMGVEVTWRHRSGVTMYSALHYRILTLDGALESTESILRLLCGSLLLADSMN